MLAIVDYKAGSLTSVRNAFALFGVETRVACDQAVMAGGKMFLHRKW